MSERVPEGWKRIDLEEGVLLLISGQSPNRKENSATGDSFGILKTTAIDWGRFDEGQNQEVLDDYKPNKKHLVLENDILITKAGPSHRVGVVAQARNLRSKVLLSGKMTAIRVNDKLISNFLTYALCREEAQKHLQINTTGMASSQTNFTHAALLKMPILSPPLLEQKKIASILNSVDEVIENTQKQIDKIQDLKKATMNELLTKGVNHTEFKDSELGKIPQSWEVTCLGNIGDFAKGKGILKEETTSHGMPCIRYAEIYTEYDYVVDVFKTFISLETINTTKKLKTNDIIFAGSGETVEDIGKSVAFVSNFDAYVGGDSIIFSPNIECNSVFLSYQLNDDLRRIQLRKMAQGGSVIHVYQSGVEQLKIGLPPIMEQNKIVEYLLSYTKAIKAKKIKLSQTQSLKKSLMQDLLTGKVRVQVK